MYRHLRRNHIHSTNSVSHLNEKFFFWKFSIHCRQRITAELQVVSIFTRMRSPSTIWHSRCSLLQFLSIFLQQLSLSLSLPLSLLPSLSLSLSLSLTYYTILSILSAGFGNLFPESVRR